MLCGPMSARELLQPGAELTKLTRMIFSFFSHDEHAMDTPICGTHIIPKQFLRDPTKNKEH